MSKAAPLYRSEIADALHLLMEELPEKLVQGKLWKEFHARTPDSRENDKSTKKHFKKHPQRILNSDSDLLSSRNPSEAELVGKNDDRLDEKRSDLSIRSSNAGEVVTLRKSHKRPVEVRSDQEIVKVLKKKSESDAGVNSKKSALDKKNATSILKHDLSSEDLKRAKRLYQTDINRGVAFFDNTDLKLNRIMQKALNCMEDIRLQIDAGYLPPDGREDFERRKKRAMEFASRFARNYLYQLNRQINEIRKLLGRANFSTVLHKLVSSYQTILQGLTAYHNHLPSTICLGAPDKVKELLRLCFILSDIHRNFFTKDINCNNKTHEIIDVRSKCLLDKIEETFDVTSTVSLAQSNHSKLACHEKSLQKKRAMKSRYSMYTALPTRKDANWKRAIASLAKKKFNVQSRYKTANFKHRPPLAKPTVATSPPKTKMPERKSSASLKPPLNDDVQTMVQVQQEEKSEDTSSEPQNVSRKVLAPLVEKLLQKLIEDNKDMSQDQVKNILQGLTEMVRTRDDVDRPPKTEKEDGDELGSKPTPGTVVTGDDGPQKLATVRGGKEIKREEVNRRGKKQTITVTGARNARLICIKDEDSLTEPSAKPTNGGSPPDGPGECNRVQSKISLGGSEHASKIKISRLPKPRDLTKLKMLPKEHALNVLQYKIQFSKAKKNNPMYKKSSYVQPWNLMGIIADAILEELLVSLGKEIQIGEVIERIYASEFV